MAVPWGSRVRHFRCAPLISVTSKRLDKVRAAKRKEAERSARLHSNATAFMLMHFISLWQKAAKIISLHPYWKWDSKARPVIFWGKKIKKKEKKQGYGWQVAFSLEEKLVFSFWKIFFFVTGKLFQGFFPLCSTCISAVLILKLANVLLFICVIHISLGRLKSTVKRKADVK